MPTAATMAPGSGTAKKTNGDAAKKPVASVPFIRASAEHVEYTNIDVSRQLTGSTQDLGIFEVPAYGYVRSLLIKVTASGGTGGTPAVSLAENAPFAGLSQVMLTEPNGATISQFNDGHELYLANKWGGYQNAIGADPKASPFYVAPTTAFAGFSYFLRIPVEINGRHGLGSLPNQNAASTFKLRLSLAGTSAYGTGTFPTTLPTVRVQVFLEAWDQPEGSSAGMANQVTPPALNTTQFWSTQYYNVNAGEQTIRLQRVGNYIRNLVLTYTRTGGTRANGEADWPQRTTLYLDTRPIAIIDKDQWNLYMSERTGYGTDSGTNSPANDSPRGLDNGVFVYDLTHEFDGTLGFENNDLWLPTLGSTRLEIQGNFANAGTLRVQTNDVAIAGSVFL